MTENLMQYLKSSRLKRQKVIDRARSYEYLTRDIKEASDIDKNLQEQINQAFEERNEVLETLPPLPQKCRPRHAQSFAMNGLSIPFCSRKSIRSKTKKSIDLGSVKRGKVVKNCVPDKGLTMLRRKYKINI